MATTRWCVALVLGILLSLANPAGIHAQMGGSSAAGASGGAGGPGGGPPPMTAITYRQGLMQQMQANMSALSAIRNGQAGDAAHVLARATILQQLTSMLSDAFTADPTSEGTRSRSEIWVNPAGFAEAVEAAQAAAAALVEAAGSGDPEQIAAAQMALQGTCGNCHSTFRGPPPGR